MSKTTEHRGADELTAPIPAVGSDRSVVRLPSLPGPRPPADVEHVAAATVELPAVLGFATPLPAAEGDPGAPAAPPVRVPRRRRRARTRVLVGVLAILAMVGGGAVGYAVAQDRLAADAASAATTGEAQGVVAGRLAGTEAGTTSGTEAGATAGAAAGAAAGRSEGAAAGKADGAADGARRGAADGRAEAGWGSYDPAAAEAGRQ